MKQLNQYIQESLLDDEDDLVSNNEDFKPYKELNILLDTIKSIHSELKVKNVECFDMQIPVPVFWLGEQKENVGEIDKDTETVTKLVKKVLRKINCKFTETHFDNNTGADTHRFTLWPVGIERFELNLMVKGMRIGIHICCYTIDKILSIEEAKLIILDFMKKNFKIKLNKNI